MEKVKEVFNTIINKIKQFYLENIKDSKLAEFIFYSFLFVMVILSLISICVAISFNNRKSVVMFRPQDEEEVKEIGTGSFLDQDDDQDNQVQDDSDNTSENNNTEDNNTLNNNTQDDQNNSNNSSNNNSQTNTSDKNSSTSKDKNSNSSSSKDKNSSSSNNSDKSSNSSNNNSSSGSNNNNNNDNKDKGSSGSSSGSSGNKDPEPDNAPKEVKTISCTSSTKKIFKGNDKEYQTRVVEQITARFDASTNVFYQADVSIAFYYSNSTVDDLELLQSLYEKHFAIYAGYFGIKDYKSVYTKPTEAYINLKNLNYQTYYKGYGKETATYDSFKYTFETGGYYCQV